MSRSELEEEAMRYQTIYRRSVLTGIAVVCIFTLGLIVGMLIR